MYTNHFHGTCFLNESIIFYSHRPRQGSNFMDYQKTFLFMLHFHNPHPQAHQQNLRCWLHVQQLIGEQDNYQRTH